MRPAKKQAFLLIALLAIGGRLPAQDDEIFLLPVAVSKDKTIVYKRVIRFVKDRNGWQVRDYFENGQIQMDAFYSSFDRNVKEEYQCNYRSNTKEGEYRQWYANGRLEFSGNYEKGLRNGPSTSWYENGIKEAVENWLHGQLHGAVKYWTEQGELQFDLEFDHGMNRHPAEAHYRYLEYLPKGYAADPAKKWPLVIFLHGGSRRGSDLKKLYADGIFDQVYRGRDFPFVIAAPQCPEHIRWSTENWFENFFREVTGQYRIDRDRVYLTGNSLGGSGTWYLAVKYPEKFAAIAPLCGFTTHMEYIEKNIARLNDMPIWAFHGKMDAVVPFEETKKMVRKLEGKNEDLRFTIEPAAGHGIHWQVYPGQELYDWFLKHDRRQAQAPPPIR
ncbi:MAG TPA: prolyl oligopeptidase family serine peptidase [Candidatus Aminicenantes bacterium]|nr:prolyl oligopeptidase family serine peptidase [Candidatus Aminicenantes bacterium]